MAEPKKTIKPGWKTTEFWFSILTAAAGLVVASGAVDVGLAERVVGGVAAILLGLGYTVSRTQAKK